MSTIYEICIAKPTIEEETWYTLDSLGISAPARERVLAATDSFTLNVTSQTALTDEAALFAYNNVLRVRRTVDGVSTYLFLGRVKPISRNAQGENESYQVTIAGLWDWFECTPMRQEWKEFNGTSYVSVMKPRVILFKGANGRITTGAQIEACIEAAIAAGCPCASPAVGDIMTGYTPPYDEQINISIANAIIRALGNHPHASCWFDYSTRTPRFYVRTRQSLNSVTLSVAEKEDVSIRARNDIRPTAVAICYEKDVTIDDKTRKATILDYAPVIAEETIPARNDRLMQTDVLWGVFDLAGSSLQNVSQDIEVEALPSGWATDKAWWKKVIPRLADYADGDIEIISATRSGAEGYTSILKKGAVQKWMNKGTERETFKASFKLSRYVVDGLCEISKEDLQVELPMTDATTKTYKAVSSYDSGESVPNGVAALMWAEWQQLHHEGSITLVEQECSLTLGVGKSLCLSEGRAEWAGMEAMISRVYEDFDTGTTTVEFGIPGWIDLDSRVAWYRNCRNRHFAFSRNQQDEQSQEEDGSGGGGIEETTESRDTGNKNETLRKRFFDPDATVAHVVDIFPQGLEELTPPPNGAQEVKLRALRIWENDGTTATGAVHLRVMQQYVLMSEPEFVEHIDLPVGEKGDPGEPGEPGPQGPQGPPGPGGVGLVQEPLYLDGEVDPTLKLMLKTNGGLKVQETEGVIDGLEISLMSHSGLKVDTSVPSKGLHLEGLTPGTAPTGAFAWGWNGSAYVKFSFTNVSLT